MVIVPPTVLYEVSYVTVPVGPKVAFVNHNQAVGGAELGAAVAALSRQMNEQHALPPPFGYGIGARLRAIDSDDPPPDVDEWVLHLHKGMPDLDGALAYHMTTQHGMPEMHCFPDADRSDGFPWQVSASHELIEAVDDPFLWRCAQAPDGRMWAYETCDSVEADVYEIDGVPVSNFALPFYFEPPEIAPIGIKYDWLGLVQAPYELRPGGYGQWWDPIERLWREEYNASNQPRPYRKARAGRIGRSAYRRLRNVGGKGR